MKERMISRGDLFYYDFGERVGSVQSGERPVLVVQADDYNKNAPTVIVAAVTSVIKKRYLPSQIILGAKFGLMKPSMGYGCTSRKKKKMSVAFAPNA